MSGWLWLLVAAVLLGGFTWAFFAGADGYTDDDN